MSRPEDLLHLDRGDHRRLRAFLAPHVFYPYDEGETSYPPASDVMPPEAWEGVMDLATDVALKTSSYSGSVAARLHELHSDWIFSWPTDEDAAPFMFEVALLAGEEIDALVFNAMHGFYRQALGCLRNALETTAIAAGLAVTNNNFLFAKWRRDGQEITFGQGRTWLREPRWRPNRSAGRTRVSLRQRVNGVDEGAVRDALCLRAQPVRLQQRRLLGEQRAGVSSPGAGCGGGRATRDVGAGVSPPPLGLADVHGRDRGTKVAGWPAGPVVAIRLAPPTLASLSLVGTA